MWPLLALFTLTGLAGKIGQPEQAAGPTLAFAILEKPKSRMPRCLVMSAALHLVAVIAGIAFVDLLRFSEVVRVSDLIRSASVQRVTIRMPERSYYPAASTRARLGILKGKHGQATGGVAPRPRPALASAPQVKQGPILLQPATPLVTQTPAPHLPAFLYWIAGKLEVSRPVDPGAATPVRSTSLQQAEPGLQAPNAEAKRGPLSLARAESERSNVSAVPSSTTPVQTPLRATDASTGSAVKGHSVAAVSVSPVLPENHETVVLPPVTVAGGGHGTGGTGGGDSRPNSVPGASTAAGTGPSLRVDASAAFDGTQGRNDAVGTGGKNAHLLPAAATAGVRVVQTAAGRVEVTDFSDGSQRWRYPENGSFDVVILQAGGGDLVPEGEALLTGKPVQTVYLTVGTGREWVLQYCLPRESAGGVTQSGMVVSLAAPPKLEAPWIQAASLPPAAPAKRSRKRSLYYGVLAANGRFRSLRSVGGSEYAARPELMAYLDTWQFLPARKDGVPADVEVLLIVPGEAEL